MLWLKTRTPDTRQLVRAEHRLLITRRSRSWLWVVLVMLCMIAALVNLRISEGAAHEQQLIALTAENQSLQDALAQGALQHQEAEATQEQLLGRIAKLSAQIERLQTDLAFFRQQKKAR
ncbi:hypothetical protein [Pseudomonas sp. SST3]|uniref:hypothetical protein n=1 Tax=Pseudomonas sp. SST3 TaxID=2267882 RepID=UPI000E02A39F|nr:hypothetical protein [Pseudomonas sp. SST3]NKQ12516.1 hypothetical protein [Pseudomonas sp. SST3]